MWGNSATAEAEAMAARIHYLESALETLGTEKEALAVVVAGEPARVKAAVNAERVRQQRIFEGKLKEKAAGEKSSLVEEVKSLRDFTAKNFAKLTSEVAALRASNNLILDGVTAVRTSAIVDSPAGKQVASKSASGASLLAGAMAHDNQASLLDQQAEALAKSEKEAAESEDRVPELAEINRLYAQADVAREKVPPPPHPILICARVLGADQWPALCAGRGQNCAASGHDARALSLVAGRGGASPPRGTDDGWHDDARDAR